jgi:hypothetical protein
MRCSLPITVADALHRLPWHKAVVDGLSDDYLSFQTTASTIHYDFYEKTSVLKPRAGPL